MSLFKNMEKLILEVERRPPLYKKKYESVQWQESERETLEQALAFYQNFLYSSWSIWKVFLDSFLNPHTIYKTACFTDIQWLLLTLGCTQCCFLHWTFLILRRRAHTHAVSVRSITYWEKKVAHTSNLLVAVSACSLCHHQQLFHHCNSLVDIVRLALRLSWTQLQ
jgi:hypothetical protein